MLAPSQRREWMHAFMDIVVFLIPRERHRKLKNVQSPPRAFLITRQWFSFCVAGHLHGSVLSLLHILPILP
jgi:hypothetical protein